MPLMKSRPSPLGVPIEPTMRYTLFALPPMAVFSARCEPEPKISHPNSKQ